MALRAPRIQIKALAPREAVRRAETAAPAPEVMPQIKSAKPRNTELQERLRQTAVARAEVKAAEAAQTESCKRRARRKTTTLPGLLTFKTMRTQIVCTVVDMSGTGAQVRLPHATAAAYGDLDSIPDKLTLVLRADRMQVECEIKWRRGNCLGVRFLGPPVPIPRA
ncbi:MAG: PilZ domain-containing protein [Hyphomicrobiaceae bacterium]